MTAGERSCLDEVKVALIALEKATDTRLLVVARQERVSSRSVGDVS
jgi:hypothetical protein